MDIGHDLIVEWEWSWMAKRDGEDGADEALSSAHCPLDLWTSLLILSQLIQPAR